MMPTKCFYVELHVKQEEEDDEQIVGALSVSSATFEQVLWRWGNEQPSVPWWQRPHPLDDVWFTVHSFSHLAPLSFLVDFIIHQHPPASQPAMGLTAVVLPYSCMTV